MAIVLAKPVMHRKINGAYGPYIVEFNNRRLFPAVNVYEWHPNRPLFKKKHVACYVLGALEFEADQKGVNVNCPNSLIYLAEFAVDKYEKQCNDITTNMKLAKTQAEMYES